MKVNVNDLEPKFFFIKLKTKPYQEIEMIKIVDILTNTISSHFYIEVAYFHPDFKIVNVWKVSLRCDLLIYLPCLLQINERLKERDTYDYSRQ